MNKEFGKVYADILAVCNSGKIGTPQVCVISTNTLLTGELLKEKMADELSLISAVCKGDLDKEKCVEHKQPYAYGFISREYKNGNIGRYTYTSAPIAENTQITVYGTDGELRFDSATMQIVLFAQVPDYTGDIYKGNANDCDYLVLRGVETRGADEHIAKILSETVEK